MNRPSTSSRENPKVIWVRSLVPNEKNSATSAISPAASAARGRLDHRADEVVDRSTSSASASAVGRDLAHPVGEQRELGLGDDERDHDLDVRIAARLLARDRGLDDRLRLHPVEPGLEDAEATPAGAEHRVGLTPQLRGREQAPALGVELALGVVDEELLDVGEELVQRRVEQADGDGQAVHRLEDALEVGALELLELGQRLFLLHRAVGEDEPLHQRQPVAQEHVLGAAEADALGAERCAPPARRAAGRRWCARASAGRRRPTTGWSRTDRPGRG